MLFQIFNTNLEGFIYIAIILVILIFVNRGVTLLLRVIEVSKKSEIMTNFILKLISVVLIFYLILDGFPLMKQLSTDYPSEVAVFTGAVSTALAFATSGVFSNLVSGFVLFSIKPFEVGDIIQFGNEIGAVRRIKLTTTAIETFDNIIVEKSNDDIVSSVILNYTIDVSKIKRFVDFKKKLHYTENILPPDHLLDSKAKDERDLKDIFEKIVLRKNKTKIHNYLFTMDLLLDNFHGMIAEVEKVCQKYKNIFGFKPVYHIVNLNRDATIRFRILTFNSSKIFNYQPEFAKEIYTLIFRNYLSKQN